MSVEFQASCKQGCRAPQEPRLFPGNLPARLRREVNDGTFHLQPVNFMADAFCKRDMTARYLLPAPSNVPLLRALWFVVDGIVGLLKGSWGVLVEAAFRTAAWAFRWHLKHGLAAGEIHANQQDCLAASVTHTGYMQSLFGNIYFRLF